jgi:hypothetical protein
MSDAVASYLPETMLIHLSPNSRLFAHDDVTYQPSALVLGYFFHEYVHYLHNISTLSGIVVFINTIDLWRSFRETFGIEGFSRGSEDLSASSRQRLKVLVSYLDAARRDNKPDLKYVWTPNILQIRSANLQNAVTQSKDCILSEVICDAVALDHDGNDERCVVRIGTLEVLECAAWLLEKRIVLALDADATVSIPRIFPYRVIEALAAFIAPAISEDAVLACALAALQSSDAPEALLDILKIAARASRDGKDPIVELRGHVSTALKCSRSKLDRELQKLEQEFRGKYVFPSAMRNIVDTTRAMFELRNNDPFFELDFVSKVAAKPSAFVEMLREFVPCAVVQEHAGGRDDLQRDFLFSFRPLKEGEALDPENGLRVIHSLFHFTMAHKRDQGFIATKATRSCCPFYTCCDLKLRQQEPAVCREAPWLSRDWKGWENTSCWYGAGVQATRPEHPASCEP